MDEGEEGAHVYGGDARHIEEVAGVAEVEHPDLVPDSMTGSTAGYATAGAAAVAVTVVQATRQQRRQVWQASHAQKGGI